MQHLVTVQRSVVARSASGSTTFVYSTVASGVKCSLQEGGGRMRQRDEGQAPGRVQSALFGEEMIGQIQQNDVLVEENVEVGRKFKVYHVHVVPDSNAPHVEASVEQLASAGGD